MLIFCVCNFSPSSLNFISTTNFYLNIKIFSWILFMKSYCGCFVQLNDVMYKTYESDDFKQIYFRMYTNTISKKQKRKKKCSKYSEQFKFRFAKAQTFMRRIDILCNVTATIYWESSRFMLNSHHWFFSFELKRKFLLCKPIHILSWAFIQAHTHSHTYNAMHVQRTCRYDKMLFAYLIERPTVALIHFIPFYDKGK